MFKESANKFNNGFLHLHWSMILQLIPGLSRYFKCFCRNSCEA